MTLRFNGYGLMYVLSSGGLVFSNTALQALFSLSVGLAAALFQPLRTVR